MPPCPIRCGDCCSHDEWTFPFKEEFLERGLRRRERTGWRGTIEEAWEGPACLFLDTHGCVLPRSQRPSVCLNFLCETAYDELNERRRMCRRQPDSRTATSASRAS